MALVLPTAIFFHVGRTAGHWVRKVVSEMEIPTYEVGAFHDWPSNIDLGALQDEHLYFCFVRHPLERSGERRVGEEGRSRGAPDHLKKKKKKEKGE